MGHLNAVPSIPPFPHDYRSSGLLLHVTSLPSPYGIGDLGPAAFEWIDQLHAAGQGWWQALPLGPTGFGNSPYQCLSSFAGNGLLINPGFLIADGLLHENDCRGAFSSTVVDYDVVIPFKHRLLKVASTKFHDGEGGKLKPAYDEFCRARATWLEDYALFRALRAVYNNRPYTEWPAELVNRVPSALAEARKHLATEIDEVRLAQFLLSRQAECLKAYARSKGVRLIGDLPFFVSPDSSDVWANPELFLLDVHRRPRFVAGVPPDYFSAHGQRWGNPVYDWDAHARTGFTWLIERIRALLAHVDVIRLDHFRAFCAAWHIPAHAATAETGEWVPGPGAAFFHAVRSAVGSSPFIVEDLGVITDDVYGLRDQFELPGTRVLQFAFDGNHENPHLPDNYNTNTVVFTGTHDNPTTREWFEGLPENARPTFWQHSRRRAGEIRDATPEMLRIAWSSRAALAIAPLQDVLNLGREGRMNVPGIAEANWRWRAAPYMMSAENFRYLRNLTTISKRSTPQQTLDAQAEVSRARSEVTQ